VVELSLPPPAVLADFAPMAERAISIEATAVLRLRGGPGRVAGFVRLPYDVIAGRSLAVPASAPTAPAPTAPAATAPAATAPAATPLASTAPEATPPAATPATFDVTVSAGEFLRWLQAPSEDARVEMPLTRMDAHWLSPLPPGSGWQRIEVVPDSAVREVVRSGALLAKDTTTRVGQQALLDSIVLRVHSLDRAVEVPLSALSGLTRMGFLPRQSSAAVDVAPGWLRVAAPFGSTYLSSGLSTLGLLNVLR
jgi:hypothetical protein